MSDVLNGVCALDVVKSTFDFNIGKYPLSGPDNMRTPWYGLFREDTTAVVGNGSVYVVLKISRSAAQEYQWREARLFKGPLW